MPPRKKTKSTRPTPRVRTITSNTASMAPESDATETKAVAKQPARRHLRGKRGGLRDMLNMPLDVVVEIMRLLHPRDLLNLARTSKSCRELLMSRKYEFLWKAARAGVEGLPDLPPWLSEPAYANLVFFTNCHNCLKPNVHTVYYRFSVRLCKDDCGHQLMKGDAVNSLIQNVKDQVGEHAVKAFLSTAWCRMAPRHIIYFKPQVDAFRLQWNTLTDRDEQIQFVKDCSQTVVARECAAEALHKWVADQTDLRKKELAGLRDARFEAIKTRLRDAGWSKELDAMDDCSFQRLRELPAVRRPTELTDRAWNGMRDDVVSYVQASRDEQLSREQYQRLQTRIRLLRAAFGDHLKESGRLDRLRTTADACEPEAGDLAYLPEFREAIEAPAEVDVSKETFAELLNSWPDLVARWVGQRKAEFEKVMRPALKGTPAADAEGILDLAVATFSCFKCWGVRLRWPAVLNHPCFRPQFPLSWEDLDKAPFDKAICTTNCYRDVFNAQHACVGAHFGRTRNTIRACGQDPDTVTWETMQANVARLMCKLCSTADRCQIFDWVAAAIHDAEHWDDILDPDDVIWQRVPDDQAVQATKLAETLDASTRDEAVYTTGNGQHYLACALCSRSHFKDIASLKEHIKKSHGKKNPVNGVDLFALEESYPRACKGLPPVWMYSVTLAKNAEVKSVVEAGRGFFASGLPSEIAAYYTTLADDLLDSEPVGGWYV